MPLGQGRICRYPARPEGVQGREWARGRPAFYAGALPSLPSGGGRHALIHAYWSLHVRLKTVAPDCALVTPAGQPPEYAQMPDVETKRLASLLDRGAKRVLDRSQQASGEA